MQPGGTLRYDATTDSLIEEQSAPPSFPPPESLRCNDDNESLCNDDISTISDMSSNAPSSPYPETEPNKDSINFINTNARSLTPKMGSLLDYFDELDLSFAVVTESWMKDGKKLGDDLLDLEDETSLVVLYKNRPSR